MHKMKLINKWASKGFTLVELLIATIIFAFAISGILLLFIKCASLDQANRNASIATTHAESVMEDIMEYMRSADITPLQAQIETPNLAWNWNTATIGSKLACPSPYVYPCVLDNETITTTCVHSSDPLEITVKVEWKELTRQRSLELKTLISKR